MRHVRVGMSEKLTSRELKMHRTNTKTGLRTSSGGAALLIAVVTAFTVGCSTNEVAGGLLGGAAVGGAYEYQNKQAMEDLNEDLEQGRITEDEYERRREEIEHRSIVY